MEAKDSIIYDVGVIMDYEREKKFLKAWVIAGVAGLGALVLNEVKPATLMEAIGVGATMSSVLCSSVFAYRLHHDRPKYIAECEKKQKAEEIYREELRDFLNGQPYEPRENGLG